MERTGCALLQQGRWLPEHTTSARHPLVGGENEERKQWSPNEASVVGARERPTRARLAEPGEAKRSRPEVGEDFPGEPEVWLA